MKFFILGMLFSLTAFAGGREGGGGAGVVCKNQQGQILSVKLLDLDQGEKDGLSIKRSSMPVQGQVNAALKKLDTDIRFDIKSVLSKIQIKELPLNVTSSQRYDLGETPVLIEDGCSIEWIAFYKDGNEALQIVTKYHSRLSNTDKAALLVHEAIYRLRRGYFNEGNSETTRSIVARLFATDDNEQEISALTQDMKFSSKEIVKVSALPNQDLKLKAVLRNNTAQKRGYFSLNCYDIAMNEVFSNMNETIVENVPRIIDISKCYSVKYAVGLPLFNGGEVQISVIDSGATIDLGNAFNYGPLGDYWSTLKFYPKSN